MEKMQKKKRSRTHTHIYNDMKMMGEDLEW